MKNTFFRKITLCFFFTLAIIGMLQIVSLATSENLQMIEKGENQFIIYVYDTDKQKMVDEKFEFAFSNDEATDKETLEFVESALDKEENGNHIAYVEDSLYTTYFKEKEDVFIWVKQDAEYIIEAQKIDLAKTLSEQDIQNLNKITTIIPVKVGEKDLPEEEENGVKITRKIGLLTIENSTGNYSYKIVKSTEGSDVAKLIELANKINSMENENIFEKLTTYNEFKDIYNKLKPEVEDKKWTEVKDNTIEQPQNAKTGEQYLVWLKQEVENEETVIDVQIMTCKDEYTPEYETQERVIKETSILPITGDNITLFVVAGILIVLIAVVITLKIKSNKIDNKQ